MSGKRGVIRSSRFKLIDESLTQEFHKRSSLTNYIQEKELELKIACCSQRLLTESVDSEMQPRRPGPKKSSGNQLEIQYAGEQDRRSLCISAQKGVSIDSPCFAKPIAGSFTPPNLSQKNAEPEKRHCLFTNSHLLSFGAEQRISIEDAKGKLLQDENYQKPVFAFKYREAGRGERLGDCNEYMELREMVSKCRDEADSSHDEEPSGKDDLRQQSTSDPKSMQNLQSNEEEEDLEQVISKVSTSACLKRKHNILSHQESEHEQESQQPRETIEFETGKKAKQGRHVTNPSCDIQQETQNYFTRLILAEKKNKHTLASPDHHVRPEESNYDSSFKPKIPSLIKISAPNWNADYDGSSKKTRQTERLFGRKSQTPGKEKERGSANKIGDDFMFRTQCDVRPAREKLGSPRIYPPKKSASRNSKLKKIEAGRGSVKNSAENDTSQSRLSVVRLNPEINLKGLKSHFIKQVGSEKSPCRKQGTDPCGNTASFNRCADRTMKVCCSNTTLTKQDLKKFMDKRKLTHIQKARNETEECVSVSRAVKTNSKKKKKIAQQTELLAHNLTQTVDLRQYTISSPEKSSKLEMVQESKDARKYPESRLFKNCYLSELLTDRSSPNGHAVETSAKKTRVIFENKMAESDRLKLLSMNNNYKEVTHAKKIRDSTRTKLHLETITDWTLSEKVLNPSSTNNDRCKSGLHRRPDRSNQENEETGLETRAMKGKREKVKTLELVSLDKRKTADFTGNRNTEMVSPASGKCQMRVDIHSLSSRVLQTMK
jgi:hypothetical protein